MRSVPESYARLDRAQRVEHRAWMRRQANRLVDDRSTDDPHVARSAARRLSAELLDMARILATSYGTPDLGNKSDPVDELVYIVLSRRTREGAYQAAFDSLRSRYATWEELAVAETKEIEDVIRFSGLGRRKAQSLKLALQALIDHFGRCSLEPTRSWSDGEVLEFLSALPEIGPKSAACVMMCSLDRPAFPVDAHVGRVLERLGMFGMVGIELAGTDHKTKQRLLWDAVPPVLRYPLHVNLLVHGRQMCLPRAPRCGQCVLARRCQHLLTSVSTDGSAPAD